LSPVIYAITKRAILPASSAANVYDVRVVELRGHLGFAQEPVFGSLRNANSGGNTLMATVRFKRRSFAL
jgi:hypothetical protein